MSACQNENEVKNGSIINGDNNVSVSNVTYNQYSTDTEAKGINGQIARIYASIKRNGFEDESQEFCEKLQHYICDKNETDIRSLEEKLEDSGRGDLVFFATQLKERAAKNIMRMQTSAGAQKLYVILLDQLHYEFIVKINPLVQYERSRIEIDGKVDEIIGETFNLLGGNDLELTKKDILGLLFFLAGNCYIRWDKC